MCVRTGDVSFKRSFSSVELKSSSLNTGASLTAATQLCHDYSIFLPLVISLCEPSSMNMSSPRYFLNIAPRSTSQLLGFSFRVGRFTFWYFFFLSFFFILEKACDIVKFSEIP